MVKLIKILSVILVPVLIFNITLARAEEELVPEDHEVIVEKKVEAPAEGEIGSEGQADEEQETGSNSSPADNENTEAEQNSATEEEEVTEDKAKTEEEGDAGKESEEEADNSEETLVITNTSNEKSASPTSKLLESEIQAKTSAKTAIIKLAPASLSEEEIAETLEDEGAEAVKKEVVETVPESIETQNNQPVVHNIDMSISRRPVINGVSVIAQWQMSLLNGPKFYGQDDDSITSGSQFLPSGSYLVNHPYMTCALVAGTQTEIGDVTATVHYPKNFQYDEANDKKGCGNAKSIVKMIKYSQTEANSLLCSQVRIKNNNLVNWNKDKVSGYVYDYNHVCGQEGFIAGGQATMYCAKARLFYDDPAGDYQVEVVVKNTKRGESTGYNYLRYLELTAFDADFDGLAYGMVDEKKWKTIPGDTIWGNNSQPSVRNIGNTRLSIIIDQGDFGFGKDLKKSEWNVVYKTRVGNDAAFTSYSPGNPTILNKPLNLGQIKGMDFTVLVRKFPEEILNLSYSGRLTLGALKEDFLECKTD